MASESGGVGVLKEHTHTPTAGNGGPLKSVSTQVTWISGNNKFLVDKDFVATELFGS